MNQAHAAASNPSFTRGSGVLLHVAGLAHRHRWAAPRIRTGVKIRNCRDCGPVQLQLRGEWTKLGS